jgi:hypothetical protein
MDQLATIVIVGAIIEACVETIEWVITREFLRQRLIALGLAELVAFFFGLDILPLLGVTPPAGSPLTPAAPFIGAALTGLLLSRGANFVHDLLERLRGGQPTGGSLAT